MSANNTFRVSKTMAWLLRHGGVKFGLVFRDDGYTEVDKLLNNDKIKRFGTTFDELKMIVDTNDKKRFQLNQDQNGSWWIRATQGHSMKFQNMGFRKIVKREDIPLAVHGTYYRAWAQIKKKGLNIMGRTHIHFSIGEPGDDKVISGMRGNCQVLIYLDIQKCLDDGIELVISENNVVLTTGVYGVIEPKYFEKVIDVETGQPKTLS